LERIRSRLLALQSKQKLPTKDFLSHLIEAEELEDEYLESLDESANLDKPEEPEIDQERLAKEFQELNTFIDWARAIPIDAKTGQLLTALETGFREMEKVGAARKAIIFTESRRTQEYLKEYLEKIGIGDKVVTFNRTNTGARSTEIYKHWLKVNQDTDKITGSRPVDRRTALIENFRDHAEIMIATEAAAEGINLQFCSLVINYDLPWNPQRIEQRIGRCHRYGQKYDVVVINFLNQRNYADQRVLQLLTEKFSLFSGVFGASDDVLGSIESGMDFEKRIQAIYETCRTREAIEEAFKELQNELEADISERIQQTQQLLLEHFDEDIHDLLKLQLDRAEQRLDKMSRLFWALSKHQLKDHARFNKNDHSFHLSRPLIDQASAGRYQLIRRGDHSETLPNAHIYRLTHPLGEWVIKTAKNQSLPTAHIHFDYQAHGAKITVLERLLGQSGTLVLKRKWISSITGPMT